MGVDDLCEGEFQTFKRLFLDRPNLDDDTITRIRQLYRLDSANVKLRCDEAHDHSYKCYQHPSRDAAVVARLLDQLEFYETIISRISELIPEREN